MNRCAAAAFQEADAALNQAYAGFLTRLRGDAATTRRLREAQRAWIDFRDKQCAFEDAWAEGGTVQPFVVASCMTVATRDRTEMLRRYLKCEEGDLSCPMPAAPR